MKRKSVKEIALRNVFFTSHHIHFVYFPLTSFIKRCFISEIGHSPLHYSTYLVSFFFILKAINACVDKNLKSPISFKNISSFASTNDLLLTVCVILMWTFSNPQHTRLFEHPHVIAMDSLSLFLSFVSIKLITDGHIYSIKFRWWRFSGILIITHPLASFSEWSIFGDMEKLCCVYEMRINRREMIHYANTKCVCVCTRCGFMRANIFFDVSNLLVCLCVNSVAE